MLDFMRRQRSALKWVWIVLIFIFSVTLITLYIPIDDLGGVNVTNDVAEVGDDSVTAREFQTAYKNYIDRMKGQINPQMLRAFRFERQILDALITRHVITEEAKRLGLSVSAAEIEQKILQNPVFREGGSFIGLTRYQAILAQNNLTVDEFESSVRNEILMEKLRSFLTAGVIVSDKEVDEEYRQRNEKVKLEYFVIDPAKLEEQVSITEQDKREHYEKNKASYNVPEKRQAKYILLETLALRSQVTVTDDELRRYYEEHSSEYQLPDRVTAQHILFKSQDKTPEQMEAIRTKARGVLERAKKGEDFAALARQFSEDTSASVGGSLGSFTRGQMVPEFENVAFNLGPGAISDLVQTQFGIHIIKVNEKQEARSRPFDEMKEAVRPVVSTRKAEELAGRLAQEIAVELVNNKDLDAVAQKHKAQVRETPPIAQGDSIPELGAATDLTNRIFTMGQGDIGTAIHVERGWVVPMVTQIVPTHPASFEEAQEQLAKDVKTEKARQAATAKANQAQEQLKTKDLSTVAKAVGAEIKTSDLLTRGASLPDFGPLSDLDKEIFSLPLGKTGTPSTAGGKTLAFAVKERQEINPEEMNKARETLRAEMLPAKQEQYFNAYVQEAKKRMEDKGEIEIDEAIMNQIAQAIG